MGRQPTWPHPSGARSPRPYRPLTGGSPQRAATVSAAVGLSTARAKWRSDAPSGESAFVNMNGAPEFRALIAPRYSFTTWWSIVRFRAPSAFLTLMPVNAFDRLSTSWTLFAGY